MLRADLISNTLALERIAPEWWQLWRAADSPTPFQSPAWLIPWWRAFAPGELAALGVRRGETLVAFAPFYLERGSYGCRLLPLGIGTSDYLDVLIDPREFDDSCREIVNGYADLCDWDCWELEELPTWAAAKALPAGNCSEETSEQSACPVLPCDDGLSAIPARQQRKVRMTHHRMRRRNVTIREVEVSEISEFVISLMRLHQVRWADKGRPGLFSNAAVRRFHGEALAALAGAELLHAFIAEADGRAVGAYYGLLDPTRAYAYIGGFDPEFAHESPGTALIAAAIESAHANGAREFHFLRGREAYKYAWGARDCWNLHRSLRRSR